MKKQLILASTSPRRKTILSYFSYPFKCISSNFDEKTFPFIKDPKQYVQDIAEKKALALPAIYKDSVILTADTIVFYNNKIYIKPKNAKEAYLILKDLSNAQHQVFTGVCVKYKDKIYKETEETKVLFHPISEKQMKRYHEMFYFSDKAGGYAIQEAGSIIIKQIVGCYYNVMGLPINTVKNLLFKVGIDLWDFLKPI